MLGLGLISQRIRAVLAEFTGTMLLVMIVVGSGLQGPALGADIALSLVINVVAASLGLWVLITLFAPISGAHFNPAVTLMLTWQRRFASTSLPEYLLAQLLGGLAGVTLANLMYLHAPLTWSTNLRGNFGTGLSELVATVGLLLVISLIGLQGYRFAAVGVATWIGAAAFATASTAFANPVMTLSRIFAADGVGIDPASAAMFVVVELAAVPLAVALIKLFETNNKGEI